MPLFVARAVVFAGQNQRTAQGALPIGSTRSESFFMVWEQKRLCCILSVLTC